MVTIDAATEQFIEDFLTAYRASPRSKTLRRAYLRQAAREIPVPLLEATTDQVDAWLGSHDWAPSTTRGKASALQLLYRWAVRTGRRASDPMADMTYQRVTRGVPRPVPLSRYRAARAKAEAKGPRLVLMLDLPARMGLRRAEAAAAHTDDFDEGRMRVRGKGGGERLVPVPPDVQRLVDELPVGWLFPSRKGSGSQHIKPDRLGQIVTELLGGGDWTTHTLRHRFATNVLNATDNLRITQELLGHASPETTAIYTQLQDNRKRSAVEAAEQLLNQIDPGPQTAA